MGFVESSVTDQARSHPQTWKYCHAAISCSLSLPQRIAHSSQSLGLTSDSYWGRSLSSALEHGCFGLLVYRSKCKSYTCKSRLHSNQNHRCCSVVPTERTSGNLSFCPWPPFEEACHLCQPSLLSHLHLYVYDSSEWSCLCWFYPAHLRCWQRYLRGHAETGSQSSIAQHSRERMGSLPSRWQLKNEIVN